MSEATERLLVRIDATTEQLRRELKKADDAVASSDRKIAKSVESIAKAFTGLGAIIGAAGLGLAFRKVIASTSEQERVTTQLNTTLESTQFAAGRTAEQLTATASSLQKVTRYGDEAIIGMQSLLLTFKSIKGDNFDRATKAVLDMSTAMGQDLKSSVQQIGKALDDPIGQLGALSRSGVKLNDSQKDLIKTLVETGNTAEAQIIILKELESQFGGSAEAARNTLAGALDGLSNAFGDLFEAQQSATKPMIESLNELEGIVTNPEFVGAFQSITSSIINMGAAAAKSLPDLVGMGGALANLLSKAKEFDPVSGFSKWLGENIAKLIDNARSVGLLKDRLDELGEELVKNDGYVIHLDGSMATWQSRLAAADAIIDKASASLGELSGQQEKVTKSAGKLSKIYTDLTKQKNIAKHHKEVADEIINAREKLEEYIEAQEWELEMMGKTEREQASLNAVRNAGIDITDKLTASEQAAADAISKNADALYDANEAAKASQEATRQMESAWGNARDTLSGFFFEFARDSQNAFDTIVDGFKAMIAKMIAEAAANRIILGIGSLAGGLGFSSAASAAAGIAGSGASSLSLVPGIGDWFSQNSSFFTNQGLQNAVPGDGGAALGPQFSWANAGMNVAGGLAGGYLSNKVFGQSSGTGALLGGLAGSALIPIPGVGTAIGSFLGGGIESLLGGKNNGNNRAVGTVDLGTGQQDIYGVGKSFNQANVDALNEIAPILKEIAEGIGGSNAILEIAMGNRSGLSLNGQKFGQDEAGFIAAAIETMVDGAEGLSKTLKTLIKNFNGTSDEMISFATSLVSIEKLISENPIDKAFKDYADAQKQAGLAMVQTYNEQIRVIKDLTYNFDGSAQAAVRLNTALSENKQYAYDMAMAINAIGESTASQVQGQLQYFFDQTRTDDEKLVAFQAQFERLWDRLPQLTDPGDIQRVSDRLLELNKIIFDLGPDDLQRSNVSTYANSARTIEEMTTSALDRAGAMLESSQRNLNTEISAMLEVTAQGFQASSDTMYSAAELMYLAVTNFVNGNSGYSEVVA